MSAPKRWFNHVVLFLLLITIVACGTAPAATTEPTASTAAEPTTAPASGDAATAAPSDATVEAPAGGTAQEPVTLTIWSEGGFMPAVTGPDEVRDQVMNMVTTEFMKENPGITVVLQDQGWDEALRQNLTNALLGGTAPDIIVGENFFQQYAALDALVPLDDAIADIKDNLIPGTYQAGVYNGKVYGISAMTGVFGFERNCTVIEKAGLNCDNPPKTWDELLVQAKEITEKGAGEYYGYTLQGPVGFSVGGIFRVAVYLAQAGAPMCKDDCTQPYFNNPDAVPVLEFLREINKSTPPGLTFNPDEGQVYTQLFQNKSAYQIAGSWHTNWAKDSGCADCRYSAIPLPTDGNEASVIVGNVMYAVLKQSKNPDAAAKWIKYLTQDKVQDLLYPSLGRLPSTRSALTKLRPNVPESDQAFIDVLLNSKDLQVLPQWQKNPQMLWTAYNDLLTKVLTTDTPVQQLMDEAQTQAEAALK